MMLVGLALGWYGYVNYVKTPAEKRAREQPDAAPPPMLDEAELDKMRAAAGDSDPKVRWQAAQFLQNVHDPQAEEILIKMLQMDEDAGIRKDALGALADHDGKRHVPNIVAALRDSDGAVKLAALSALARIGDYTTAPAISDALKDSEEKVRLAAIDTLNQLNNKRKEELQRIEAERQRDQEELAEHQKQVQNVKQRN